MSSAYLNSTSGELHEYKIKTNKREDEDDDISSDEGYHGLSPPPPPDDMLDCFSDGEGSEGRFCYSPVEVNPKIEYNDVGEEINVEVCDVICFGKPHLPLMILIKNLNKRDKMPLVFSSRDLACIIGKSIRGDRHIDLIKLMKSNKHFMKEVFSFSMK